MALRRGWLFPRVLAFTLLGATAAFAVLETWPRVDPDSEALPSPTYVKFLAADEGGAKTEHQKLKIAQAETPLVFGKRLEKLKEADPSKRGAPFVEANRRDEDRKKVMPEGLLGAIGESSNAFGPRGLGTGINNALGGLGARGTGPGGGGGMIAQGLGGLSRAYVEPLLSAGDRFNDHGLNGFVDPASDPESTFAIDVDTASYTIVRRLLSEGRRPPPEAVRAEEIINYFDYDYPAPTGGALAVHLEAAPSPFEPERHLLRVGVQGKRLAPEERKPTHLTFLVDVSCSMTSEDRLPLAKQALHVLVDNLRAEDSVALVTYAGNVRRVLSHTRMDQRAPVHQAIEALSSGGSTAMGSGLQLAFEEARTMLRPGHVSRVIVLSDGDANVGHTTFPELLKTIEAEVMRGVTLTTVGFGMGNYRDDLMEQLADKGNGNAYYVDTLAEARRIFEDRLAGTLEVIAKDVKLQVVFDPGQVLRYRLVGYENRDVADRDFRNDAVDAGEIGAGHSVTALYELELRPNAGAGFARVHVRAKPPEGKTAVESVFALEPSMIRASFEESSASFRFATAAMGFAERLRGSPWAAGWSLEDAYLIARATQTARGIEGKEREEFTRLVRRFDELERRQEESSTVGTP